MEGVVDTVRNNISDNEVFAFDDMKVPYNGFDGFCVESVKDELNYRLSEEVHEYIVRPGEPVVLTENDAVFPEPSDQAIRKKEIELRAQEAGLSM